MKGIIKFLMWILIILLVLIAVSFFLPRKAIITRTVTIGAGTKTVFNQVNDLHSWDKWSVWNQKDPDMTTSYTLHGMGEGSEYHWESDHKDIGTGDVKITKSVPYELVEANINFQNNGEGVSKFIFDEIDDSTKVTWDFSYDTKYNPVSRWMGLFMDKTMGEAYEESLKNLKTVAEMQAQHKTFYIEIDTLESFNYLSKRVITTQDSIGYAMGEIYGDLYKFTMSNNITITDVPFTIYHRHNNSLIDVEAGLPIEIEIMGNNELIGGKYPEKRCAVIDYYGSYENLSTAYTALEDWIKKRKYKVNGSPIERYIVGMQENQDPNKWHTKVYYPID